MRKRTLDLRQALLLALLGSCRPISLHAADAAASARAEGATAVAEVQFDDSLLMRPKGTRLDVSRFGRGNPVPPGDYRLDVFVNGESIGKFNVRFTAVPDRDQAAPCFNQALIGRFALDSGALDEDGRDELARVHDGACADLTRLVRPTSYALDMSALRLEVNLPQAAQVRHPQGFISSELWETGVPSATLGYNLSAFRMASNGAPAATQTYLGLIGGIHLGDWHLRHNGSYSWQTQGGHDGYQSVATYVQHDLVAWRSQLTVGDRFTDGSLFDSLGIRGATLASDDRMLPESLRQYSPLIRGTANGNAHVKITQNGNTLYETNVAAGEFRIDDLTPTGYGGDLLVTVTEADGSQRSFSVPYAAVAQSLRPGISRYQLSIGELREHQVKNHANVAQATLQRGFTNLLTGYTGAQAANGYVAALVGASFNTRYGALSVDLTRAHASIAGVKQTRGQSLRMSYSKFLNPTNTSITVAAYRYSSRGFWGARDALTARDLLTRGQDPGQISRQRDQFQLTLSQPFGGRMGNVYASGSRTGFWDRSGSLAQFQVGYSNNLTLRGLNVSYNLSLERQRNTRYDRPRPPRPFSRPDDLFGRQENRFMANVSIPLGHSSRSPMLSSGFTHDNRSGSSEQVSVSGSLGRDEVVSYGVSASHAGGTNSGSASAQYRSSFATLSAGVAGGSGYTQQSLGMSGMVAVHGGGVTLGNALGETMAIVEAKGAEGARVNNMAGLHIDSRGYAVVPYLMPYTTNSINIDPKGIPLDVELQSTTEQVVPRANAVVLVRFTTARGRAVMMSVRLADGSTLPFGTDVRDEKGDNVGIVAQGGRLFARGLNESGRLIATWGTRESERCTFAYQLSPEDKAGPQSAHARLDAVCDGAPMAGPARATRAAPTTKSPNPARAAPSPGDSGQAPSKSIIRTAEGANTP